MPCSSNTHSPSGDAWTSQRLRSPGSTLARAGCCTLRSSCINRGQASLNAGNHLFGWCQGECERELCPALGVVGAPDASAVLLDEPPADRQTEACASVAPRVGRVGLPEG